MSANVLKVAIDGSSVSFLWYPDFDTDPHPALRQSIHVPLASDPWIDVMRGPKGDAPTKRTYVNSSNPPVLHRKEEFVASDHPLFKKFAALTRAEERAGLLMNTPGFRRQWQDKLENAGYKIWGHRLRKRTGAVQME